MHSVDNKSLHFIASQFSDENLYQILKLDLLLNNPYVYGHAHSRAAIDLKWVLSLLTVVGSTVVEIFNCPAMKNFNLDHILELGFRFWTTLNLST